MISLAASWAMRAQSGGILATPKPMRRWAEACYYQGAADVLSILDALLASVPAGSKAAVDRVDAVKEEVARYLAAQAPKPPPSALGDVGGVNDGD